MEVGEGNVKGEVSRPNSPKGRLPQGTAQERPSRTSPPRAATGNAHNTQFSKHAYSPRC